jgi:hypothetical protein
VQGPESFSMLFATDLNYLYVQAECAVDPSVTDAKRAFASGEAVRRLGSMPDLAAVSRLAAALASVG